MLGAADTATLGGLELQAGELRQRHRRSVQSPQPLASWARIGALESWLTQAQAVCLQPPPDASKAAEWLLDNGYQVQRAADQIAQDLPYAFYRRLPGLCNPGEEGLPRIFAIAQSYLHTSRLQLSMASLVQFVRIYQDGMPLSIAELWALPTMLRLACVEILVSALGHLLPDLPQPFPVTRPSRETLAFEDTECVARALANLAIIASIPWQDFFEDCSRVEELLGGDPAAVYLRMDFDTRDRYRRALEELARGCKREEPEVAEAILRLAHAGNPGEASSHVGYWLVGKGREHCERTLGYRPSLLAARRRWLFRNAGPTYAAALGLAAVAAMALPGSYLALAGAHAAIWWLGILLTSLPASVLSITLVHWLITLSVPPRVLPKLDFSQGIASDCITAVVVPVLLSSPEEAFELVEQLEIHYLANPDPSLRFVLLSDHVDAREPRLVGDQAVEQALVEGIRRLNQRYGGAFHVLHRPRLYNPGEGCWMGWERKRGKLEQFNQYLLDAKVNPFTLHEGAPSELCSVRFVVTVDADTMLPAGTVARLVGTLAHPLNRAEFDPHSGRVNSGYTVLQPRVEVSPTSAGRSLFARTYSGDTAIDIYTRAVSDVYQDLFGSGIFVGKGIYEVATFQASLAGRIPENALVSHDLFEGIHGRAALVSDIVLYEGFPNSYVEYAKRQHRWIRGDWQLLPWLRRRVPGGAGTLSNPLRPLDYWKLLDNLRRSLIPLALVVLAAAGWLLLPGSPWVWTLLTVAAPGGYLFTDLVTGLASGRRRGAVRGALRQMHEHLGRWLLALVFLVNDAAIALDAIVRTLWRLCVSRSHLLQWTTAANQARLFAARGTRAHVWLEMWPSPVFALTIVGLLLWLNPLALVPAAPLLLLWTLAPEVALRTGRPRQPPVVEPSDEQRTFMRRLARRTWLFFETFVGPDDHWLPPDNYQEEPYSEIAHRTSPTNIGMLMLSSLAAADLGYIGCSDLAARVRRLLDSLERLERHRGHWYNWYDSRLLQPLEPRYLSTVDSGNLAVCLMTLRQGCLQFAAAAPLCEQLWNGLEDTFGLLGEALRELNDAALQQAITTFAKSLTGGVRASSLDVLEREEGVLRGVVAAAINRRHGLSVAQLKDIQVWLDRLHHHLLEIRRDRERLQPWAALLASPVGGEALAQQIRERLPATLPMSECAQACAEVRTLLAQGHGTGEDFTGWRNELDAALEQGCREQQLLRRSLLEDAERAASMAMAMEFGLLYDNESRLFHIGYNLSADRMDSHHYDLLATEARLASYFAIMKGDVPLEHWFFLGRPLARMAGELALVSWNGSMFEYLMPALLLPSHPGSLLGQSERAAVAMQRQYGHEQGIPWGISESAFASRDAEHRYRYRAFGVPALGLRRDLARDLVITPYASALALAVDRAAALDNLAQLQRLGMVGLYGLYEAADYTAERLAGDRRFSRVRSYMAHHQGMILAALDNALGDNLLVRRFSEEPRVRVMELLLHERVPRELPPDIRRPEIRERPSASWTAVAPPYPWVPPSAEQFPQVQVLGNGRMSSWISSAGAGGLSWHQQALCRWQADATRDHQGLWIYLHDEQSGALWSAGRQPTGAVSEQEQVVFHPHMVEFHRHDHGIGLRMEAVVAASEDVEIRRITLVNESDRPRHIRLTSYGEVVLAPARDDERHPAFSKLFVASENLPGVQGQLFTRRPRHAEERPTLLLHRLVTDDAQLSPLGFEADREAFLGRHGDPRRPRGVLEGLSGVGTGWTLDPIMALQVSVKLEPGARRQLAFLTMAGGSRELLLELAERYATLAALEWAFAAAASEAASEIRQLGLEPARLPQLQIIASLLLYPHPVLRGAPAILAANQCGQPRLWSMSLSGDRPILLLRMQGQQDSELLLTLVRGHQLWRRRGLLVDLVILRTGASGYAEPLREQLYGLLREQAGLDELGNRNGGVFLLFADQLHDDDVGLLESVARVVLDERAGPLAQQLATVMLPRPQMPPFGVSGQAHMDSDSPLPRPPDLQFENGLGGFSADGREYLIHLQPGQCTPAPWCNVLANESFGCLVSEAGVGFSWALNSGENRLTPWSNDPLCDAPGEVLYLRDEEDAAIWTPTPQPAGVGVCQIRHGAGYSSWRQHSRGLEQELLIFVAPEDPVKLVRLSLRNITPRARSITATYYAEWLLGALPSSARAQVLCEYDHDCHTLLARNPWNPEFGQRVAFLSADRAPHSLTADRQDFLGREGQLARPSGLTHWALGGRVEAGGDPCAAFQVHLDIPAGETAEVVFLLGQGEDRAQALALARHWKQPGQAEQALELLRQKWDRRLGTIQVQTHDPGFDLLVNRWLLYQCLASRVLARAGFYQASGAIGFRDQLQDMLALLHVEPQRVRAHILACAAHQFEEGDVLHWWHPPQDRGVRTRCSDDLLWLPYVTSCYVAATGDSAILEESVSFLQAPPLRDDEHDRYARFPSTAQSYPLFEHCKRALQRGVTEGANGLPLMAGGDWNDGMDRVGRQGRGESVWLGWFAIATLHGFADLAGRLGLAQQQAHWRGRASVLAERLKQVAWDGQWYLRALDDEGRPLGTRGDEECRIDSIAQSWSVLCGAAEPGRSRMALDSAVRHLVSDDLRIIRLLWPPFSSTLREPGYIKAYPPGVRENGGQYSHAAAWLGLAYAELGDGEGAWHIFDLLNPIRQASSAEQVARYRVEPYVLAGDIASMPPHLGRGGWTWYSGSAAWTWRLAVEGILGLRMKDGEWQIHPCLPQAWPGFDARICGEGGELHIRVERGATGAGPILLLDDEPVTGPGIAVPADGAVHRVLVRLGDGTDH